MNRYIIIFTTVTIFYLPLGFVTVSPKHPHPHFPSRRFHPC
jgi:hypothetical protein